MSGQATLPLLGSKIDPKPIFAISVALWALALVWYIIAIINYKSNQQSYNFWLWLGNLFVWIQLFTVLALCGVGVPNLFSKY